MKAQHEEIEDYVSGSMSAAEHEAFSKRLADDKELAQLVAAYRAADDALMDEGLREFVVALEEVNAKHQAKTSDQKKQKHVVLQPWLRYVAASLALLVIGTYFFWPVSVPEPQVWYAENFEPYPSQEIRAIDDRYPATLSNALSAYRQADYDAAIPVLDTWQNDSTFGVTATFFLAQAYLASGQVDQALPLLETQLAGPGSVYDQSNQWYLAMAYLFQNELNKARAISRQIIGTKGHAYRGQAMRLLSDFPE